MITTPPGLMNGRFQNQLNTYPRTSLTTRTGLTRAPTLYGDRSGSPKTSVSCWRGARTSSWGRIAAIVPEHQEIPADAKLSFDPKGINLYADSWRLELGA